MRLNKARVLTRTCLLALIALPTGCSSSSTTPPVDNTLTQAQSAADTKEFVARRERIQAITGMSSSQLKPLETLFESGKVTDWVKLDEKERTITCLFHEYRHGSADSGKALCLAAVLTHDNVIEAAKSMPTDSTMSLKEFMQTDPKADLAGRMLVGFEGVNIEDPKLAAQFKRATSINKESL